MKKFLLSILLSLPLLALAQENYTISGYIEDSNSRERLIGVNVYVPGTSIGTSTNTFGFYSLTVREPKVKVMISYVGYETQSLELELEGNLSQDISLEELPQSLAEVTVTAEQIEALKPQMSTIQLSTKDIKNIPAFLGEVDVIRAIQLLPGVQSGSEGTTGFYVRGGSPDQNLILLDGVPVYNASHLFGFFSVFNADAIKNVQLTKGGFPSRFGGRLSSVLEIDMKEGNLREFHGAGSLGIISSKLTLEGPLVKDKTSFIISGRRTYYDLLIRPFLPPDLTVGYYFGDLNLKLNHIFSRKDRLYLSYYGGNDKFYQRESYDGYGYEENFESNLQWGNHTGSLRWNHLFNEKLFSNLTATYTQYRFSVGFKEEYDNQTDGFEYFSLIRDYGLRYDLEYRPNSDHSLRFGGNYTYHTFKPGVAQFEGGFSDEGVDSLLNLSSPIYSNDAYVYVEDDWLISPAWRANFGLHYSGYLVHTTYYNSLQPRASLRYLLTDEWSVKGSYAMMNQYIHLLSNSGLSLPTDLWVSSTERIKPQRSHQVALGSVRNILQNKYEISAEVYYKRMLNLIEYKEGASFITATDWQNNVVNDGIGNAYGLELLFRKNEGQTTGWIGYTLAWSNRQFSDLNNGEQFPYKYDRRHDISIIVNHRFNEQFDLGVTWVFGSGNTYTAPIANYYLQSPYGSGGTPEEYVEYSDRNSLRLPPYHRLDLGFNFHNETRWGMSHWNISVYNAYNRKNPFFLYINENYETGEKSVRQGSLFPIIPSISYSFEF
ncbi:MAG TPA: TonB-dependent receptor [Cryomorphaceae bacterium]|nr:TonB-dependent receptor [Cryomorphaceae bacterium]